MHFSACMQRENGIFHYCLFFFPSYHQLKMSFRTLLRPAWLLLLVLVLLLNLIAPGNAGDLFTSTGKIARLQDVQLSLATLISVPIDTCTHATQFEADICT
jgi:hypothetical protein